MKNGRGLLYIIFYSPINLGQMIYFWGQPTHKWVSMVRSNDSNLTLKPVGERSKFDEYNDLVQIIYLI